MKEAAKVEELLVSCTLFIDHLRTSRVLILSTDELLHLFGLLVLLEG